MTTLYSRCSSPALSCQLLKFLLFQRVFRLLGMVRRTQIIPTKASFSRLLMQKFLQLKNRIVFWHMILMNWHVGARKDSIVTEAYHEFQETCHSTTFYFMKKDSKRCCDTTMPESIHTKDESKCRTAFAFIFGVN